MDLGVERIASVAKSLEVDSFVVPVITVAGTNGKGSTIAIMSAILQAQGLKVGATTSPHLHRFNERININGNNISDLECCELFAIIEAARGTIKITYFEFAILSALLAFKKAKVDIVLLEVGLGGRLDAVNCVQNDISVITSIDLDHTSWLGDTREKIAFEKAGIFKNNTIAVCGDYNAPKIIAQVAQDKCLSLRTAGKDFFYTINKDDTWNLESADLKYILPMPNLKVQNAATAIMALLQLKTIKISYEAIVVGLKNVSLPGRFQVVRNNNVEIIYDVAHNPAATELLVQNLAKRQCLGKTIAVFGVLNTKDYLAMLAPLVKIVAANDWHCASVASNNAVPGDLLATNINKKYDLQAISYASISQAFTAAKLQACSGDRIVVFGSFYVIAEVQSSLSGR